MGSEEVEALDPGAGTKVEMREAYVALSGRVPLVGQDFTTVCVVERVGVSDYLDLPERRVTVIWLDVELRSS